MDREEMIAISDGVICFYPPITWGLNIVNNTKALLLMTFSDKYRLRL